MLIRLETSFEFPSIFSAIFLAGPVFLDSENYFLNLALGGRGALFSECIRGAMAAKPWNRSIGMVTELLRRTCRLKKISFFAALVSGGID
jgi:hypothetical protein